MHIYLKDLGNGDEIKGIYFIKSAQQGTTQRGDPFFSIKIADSSMQMDCKIWAPLSTVFKEIPVNTFVSLEGKAQSYKENIQLSLREFRLLDEEEINNLDLSHYIATSPRNRQEMIDELYALIDEHIVYEPWQKFISYVLSDPRIEPYFFDAPGAKSIHHAYLHGLLEHTLGVCKNCMAIAQIYPQIDKQILFVAALCHDLGKIEELSGALGTEYTDFGKLVGHISIVMEILEPYYAKANIDRHLVLHLKHLILSHHGELEYGSPKVPATSEAFVLHYADNIDAKITQISQALPQVENAAESAETDCKEKSEPLMQWSAWNSLLGRQLCSVPKSPTVNIEHKPTEEEMKEYYENLYEDYEPYEVSVKFEDKASETKEELEKENKKEEKQVEQCSLL